MPENHEKPKPDVADIRAKVNEIIRERGLKQTAVARESDVSTSRLSGFLSGSYGGDNEAVAEQLAAWLDSVARKDSLPGALKGKHAFVETDISARITAALEWAQSSADLVVIIGEPGVGKTETIRNYASRSVSVWSAEMSADSSKLVAALEEVCGAINVVAPVAPSAMRRAVVRQVRNTGGCLLIDEAQHLQPAALEALRAIHDAAGVGLVLCGNPKLWERICAMPQLRSRVGRRVVLRKPTRGDVRSIMDVLGIDGKREADFLCTIAQYPGGLRCVVKTARQASLIAFGGGSSAVTSDHLAAAWAELSTEDGI